MSEYDRDTSTVSKRWPTVGCHALKINYLDLIIVLSYVALNEKYHVD